MTPSRMDPRSVLPAEELSAVADLLVPRCAEGIVVSVSRSDAAPWVRHHDRTFESKVRTLLRDPESEASIAVRTLVDEGGPRTPAGAALGGDDPDGPVADALRTLRAQTALLWRGEGAPSGRPTLLLLRGRGRDAPTDEDRQLAELALARLEAAEGGRQPHRRPDEGPLLMRALDRVESAIVLLDSDGLVVLANRAAIETLGMPRGGEQAAPGPLQLRSLEGEDVSAAALRPGDTHPWEGLARAPDGSWVPVRIRAEELADETDGSIRMLTISPLRYGGEEGSDRFWDASLLNVLLASPVPIVALDLDGRVRLWTPAAERVFGWAAGEVLGGGHPLDPKDSPGGLGERVDRMLRGGPHLQVELPLRRREGTALRTLVTGSPLRSATGAVIGALLTLVDVTESRALEEQLHQVQRMEAVGKLAGGVAHDFNNALTQIIGLAELALLELDPEAPATADVRAIGDAAHAAGHVADQLLAFSRQQMIRFEPMDLKEVVEAVEALARKALPAGIQVWARIPDETCPIRGDRGQLEHAVMNLVLNAGEAMEGLGRLTLAVRRVHVGSEHPSLPVPLDPGEYAHLTVEDTGRGMDSETLERVFEPFFTTKPRQEGMGTGLGLSTAYGIVKQLGGYIWLDSAVGEGTTATLLFPVARSVPSAPGPEVEGGGVPASGTETLLVAEDESAVRAVLERQLTDRGYTVLAAGNGAEALGLLRTSTSEVDLLVTDVVMPQLGGRDLARILREERPDLPVVYISGYTDDPALRTHRLGEREAFIAKPFRSEELHAAIRELLDA